MKPTQTVSEPFQLRRAATRYFPLFVTKRALETEKASVAELPRAQPPCRVYILSLQAVATELLLGDSDFRTLGATERAKVVRLETH